jgi:hypothetical protein
MGAETREGRAGLGGRVPFDLFGEVVHLFGPQFDAGLLESLLKDVADIILNMAQADLMDHLFRNCFRRLGFGNLPHAVVIINRGT